MVIAAAASWFELYNPFSSLWVYKITSELRSKTHNPEHEPSSFFNIKLDPADALLELRLPLISEPCTLNRKDVLSSPGQRAEERRCTSWVSLLDSLTFTQLLFCHTYMGKKAWACLYESLLTPPHLLVKHVTFHCIDLDFCPSQPHAQYLFIAYVLTTVCYKYLVWNPDSLSEFFHFKIVKDALLKQDRLQTHYVWQAYRNSSSRKNNGLKISHQKENYCKLNLIVLSKSMSSIESFNRWTEELIVHCPSVEHTPRDQMTQDHKSPESIESKGLSVSAGNNSSTTSRSKSNLTISIPKHSLWCAYKYQELHLWC